MVTTSVTLSWNYVSLDRCHTRDFIARFCHTSARLYRETKTQTLRLSSCTLRLCRINKHGFCATFSVSRSSFTNTVVPRWRLCTISNLSWALRSIVRFRFARQPTKTKLLPRISQSVMLVWFVYATKSQRATAQSHAATLSRDKIAGVTSVLGLLVQWTQAYLAEPQFVIRKFHRSTFTWGNHYNKNLPDWDVITGKHNIDCWNAGRFYRHCDV